MRSIVCESPRHLRLADAPTPEPRAGEALVRIHRVGVCGTDLHAFAGEQPFFDYPRVLGHELAGEVVSLPLDAPSDSPGPGDAVTIVPYLACGRCIACRRARPNCCVEIRVLGVHADGGLCEFLAVPATALVPAAGLGWDELALVECLSIGAHAVRRAAVEPGELSLVIGCGPIGLGVAQFAAAAGGRVIGLDVREPRLRFLEQLIDGAIGCLAGESAHAEIAALTDGDMPTVVFDATGHAASMAGALHYVAHGGRLVYVGLTRDAVSFVHPELHQREASLLASRNATRHDFETVVDGLVSGKVRASCMITHRSPFADVVRSFPAWADPASGVIKAIVDVG